MIQILVLVDGSNFYHGCKKLAPGVHLTDFKYRVFFEKISKSNKMRIVYCVGEIRKEGGNLRSGELYASQQSLFYNLGRQRIKVLKGYMLRNNGVYHEKGVDVQMAVEMVKGAYKNSYDYCYLVSSDTDLLPAIVEARRRRKKVVYVGFKGSLSKAMVNNCTKTRVITMNDIAGK